MGEIKIFESPLFGQVRTTLSASGEPQFCLKDLCDVLGLTAKGVSQRLSKEVISNYPLLQQVELRCLALLTKTECMMSFLIVASQRQKYSVNGLHRWCSHHLERLAHTLLPNFQEKNSQ